MNLIIKLLPKPHSIVRFAASAPIPDFGPEIDRDTILCITRTGSELSIVCPTASVPNDVTTRSDGWRCLQLPGPFDLSEVGILASVISPLAEARISVFVLATFDTDYVLIREEQRAEAIRVLAAAGHTVRQM